MPRTKRVKSTSTKPRRTIKFSVFEGIYERIKAAAESSSGDIASYCEHLVSWHTPYPNREVAQLRARIQELEVELASGRNGKGQWFELTTGDA